MAIDDKKCMVCGKAYKYCANDVRYNKDETWRNLYCDENCRQMFYIYKDMKAGKITSVEGAEKMKGLDITKINGFVEPFKSILLSVSKKMVVDKPQKTEVKEQSKAQPKVKQQQTRTQQTKPQQKTNNNRKKKPVNKNN